MLLPIDDESHVVNAMFLGMAGGMKQNENKYAVRCGAGGVASVNTQA